MTNEKVDKSKSNSQKIKNLLALGISQENITTMLNEGYTLDQIDDFCNNEINKILDQTMKEIMTIIAENIQGYKFFTLRDDDILTNKNISNVIFRKITEKLKEKDILYKNIKIVFETILDRINTLFSAAQSNYKKEMDSVLARLLDREIYEDITLLDIDKKSKELSKKKKDDVKKKEKK